jgi:hypothetical protein
VLGNAAQRTKSVPVVNLEGNIMQTCSGRKSSRAQVPRLEQRAAIQRALALLWIVILIWAFHYL